MGACAEPSRPAWAFTVTLYALGVAHVLRAPVIAQPLNHALHVPNLNVLLGNAMTLIGACCVLIVLVYFTDPAGRGSRRKSLLWIILLVIGLTAMTGLFVWSLAAPPVDFLEHRSAQSLAYVLIYVTYLAAGVTDACRLSVRYTRHTADRYLRVGLQMVALGSAIGILYWPHLCLQHGRAAHAACPAGSGRRDLGGAPGDLLCVVGHRINDRRMGAAAGGLVC